ncbi:MAG: hypothetical protein JWR69_144 [Pedosphaera sp.]|nr:hypothetical protein [Pedosphaera sp.]
MKTAFNFLLVVSLLLAGCGEKETGQPARSTNAPVKGSPNAGSGNPMTAPVDYLNSLGQGQQKALKTVDVASLNQAIQMFNVQEGRYPKDLNELVDSKLITKIPAAPYGMKLNYDPNSGKISVVDQ